MTEAIIVALITGGLSLLGVLITSSKTARDVQAKLDTHQAVTDTKLEELTREVREHRFWVYKHIFPNGKAYFGITSQYPCVRWKNGKGYSDNKIFTRALKKYGWDNVRHEIIDCFLTKDEACRQEIALISLHKSNAPDYGYNQSSGGEHGGTGVKVSEETRRKKSVSMMGKNVSINIGGNSAKARPVKQFTKDGKFVAEYKATTEAQRKTGVNYTGIVKCCTFNQLTAGGHIWLYAWDGARLSEKVESCNSPKLVSAKSNKKRSESMKKYWANKE